MFTFDGVFAPTTDQSAVYETTAKLLVERLFKGVLDVTIFVTYLGFNCTVLAYGQTGSGKTYTMGTESQYMDMHNANSGIAPKIIFDIFESIRNLHPTVSVSVSMLEIYNENVWDLLSKSDSMEALQIRDGQGGVNASF